MRNNALTSVMRRLFGDLGDPVAADSDRKLLERYAGSDEQAAFAALVRRHGPLVLGVCRRVLGDGGDVDDAFQATFLILARKAGSVRWRESVGNWLYKTAFRVASKARVAAARRRRHEEAAASTRPVATSCRSDLQELAQVLDEELDRLPEKLRMPLLLCCLQDQTVDEAAQQLGWTFATVKSGLQRGRDVLRDRLRRRGIALSAGVLAGVLSESVVLAIPPELFSNTITTAQAAPASGPVADLAKGVLQAMYWTNCKLALVVFLAIGVLGSACGAFLYHASASAAGTGGDGLVRQAAPPAGEDTRTKLPADARGSDGRLEVGIKPAKEDFQTGGPVPIKFTVKNVSDQPLGVWGRNCSWGHQVYSFEVTLPDGSKRTIFEPPLTWEKNSPTAVNLKPGESFGLELDLNQLTADRAKEPWKVPVAAGTYSIRGIYAAQNEFKGKPGWASLDLLWQGRLIAGPVQFTVKAGRP